MPATFWNSSPARCGAPPLPDDANDSLPGLALAKSIDLLHRFHRMLGVDRHHQRQVGDEDDRREILHRVVRQAGVEVRADAVGGDGIQQQRVAVGRRLGDVVRRDGAAGAAAVADDDRLAQRIGQLAADQAGDEIRRAAGRHRHHQRDDLAGIGVLRLGGRSRDRRERREDRGANRVLIVQILVVHSGTSQA